MSSVRKIFRPTTTRRIAFFVLFDVLLSFATLYAAYLLRFNFAIPERFMAPFVSVALTLIALKLVFIYASKNYRVIWRYYGLGEGKKLVYALVGAYALFSLIHTLFADFFAPFPRSVIIIDLILSILFLGGLRLLKRIVFGFTVPQEDLRTTVIVGVSPATAHLIQSALEGSIPYYPVAVVAIDAASRHMVGSSVQNIKVIAPERLEETVRERDVSAAIIDGSLGNDDFRLAYELLSKAGVAEIKRSALLSEGAETVAPLSVEELLARHPKDLDTRTIENFIRGKRVLITGAGGSIGSEISLQCRRFGAERLSLIDHSEYNLYQIGEQIPEADLYLCSITDPETLDRIFAETRPQIVIHAAAFKHVPLCESNPRAAVRNNILGSRVLIDCAIAHDVPKIVIISTDKAVRPTNVMGATKRVVELYAQNVDPKNSEIVSVRFGNVLGSSGSVIPKFKSQIEAGGPITITHPEITRYFMLISEACQLVLQAAAIARGGELFILDMGQPVQIRTLAETMIRLYATRPVEIVYTGLRPGEKLYEELLIDESEQKTAFESIMIARSTRYPIDDLVRDIAALEHTDDVVAGLRKIVPEFEHAKHN